VGFLDSSISPPHNYYLNVGENEDGYTVTSADIDAESANVNKNGFDIPISMGKGPGAGGTAPSSALAPAASLRVALSDRPPSPALSSTQTIATLKERLRNRIFSSDNARAWPVPANVKTIDAVLDMGIQQESYVEKLKKRRDELAAQAAASQSTAAPATEPIDSTAFLNMLRKQNMDNIRQGGGGLGVPLTPEEDAQLVKEGVLPAR